MNDIQTRFLHYVVSMLMYVGALAAALFHESLLAFLILAVGLSLWLVVVSLGDLEDAKRITSLQILIWGIFVGALSVLFLGPDAGTEGPLITTLGISLGVILFTLCLIVSVLFWQLGNQEEKMDRAEAEKQRLKAEITELKQKIEAVNILIHGK